MIPKFVEIMLPLLHYVNDAHVSLVKKNSSETQK